MPDPLLFLKAMGAAAVASVAFVLAMGRLLRPATNAQIRLISVVGLTVGLGAGFYSLHMRLAWPPMNGLDRFLTIVLPTAVAIEWVAALPNIQRWLVWVLRMGLAALLGRILLHNSVYLLGSQSDAAAGQGIAIVITCGVLTLVVWALLATLSQRSRGVAVPLALALTIQGTGIAVMLAGYLKGGSAAFPLTAAILGTVTASRLLISRPDQQATIGLGVVGLCGLLCIGRFFGGLTSGEAITLLLAPLLCWTTELSPLRRQKPWMVAAIQLALVAIPLAVVLILAKQEFDRETAPLLVQLANASG